MAMAYTSAGWRKVTRQHRWRTGKFGPAVIMLVLLGLSVLGSASVQAHLIPAQRGTLNVASDGVYMVISLPVSAFQGLDADGDKAVTLVEFNRGRSEVMQAIGRNLLLSNGWQEKTLEDVLLSPVIPHEGAADKLTSITVMGRYALPDSSGPLYFHMGLYGAASEEQSFQIAAQRVADNQRSRFTLTPRTPGALVFAATRSL